MKFKVNKVITRKTRILKALDKLISRVGVFCMIASFVLISTFVRFTDCPEALILGVLSLGVGFVLTRFKGRISYYSDYALEMVSYMLKTNDDSVSSVYLGKMLSIEIGYAEQVLQKLISKGYLKGLSLEKSGSVSRVSFMEV